MKIYSPRSRSPYEKQSYSDKESVYSRDSHDFKVPVRNFREPTKTSTSDNPMWIPVDNNYYNYYPPMGDFMPKFQKVPSKPYIQKVYNVGLAEPKGDMIYFIVFMKISCLKIQILIHLIRGMKDIIYTII